MKKNYLFKTLVVVVTAGAFIAVTLSCRTWMEPSKSVRKYEQSSSSDVYGLGVIQVPTIADLKIDPERVFHSESFNISFEESKEMSKFFFGGSFFKKDKNYVQAQMDEVEKTKESKANSMVYGIQQYAKAKLLSKFNGDILISPKFSIEIINNETIKVQVSGYIGTYHNFRPMKAVDTALFKLRPTWHHLNNEIEPGIKLK